ncbi:MAG: hypothetical protein PHW18_12915 [Sulfuricurvum sp.]|uniref:hypothetical protein n=1 Tax=Sulfuricurvum sp. TaxID=2025608 RepID=UPI002638E3B6|nr:hypothetical protein [Sulfuricurvum sp.]MDD2830468.1 hypothetical protein [Sulfuricurvum sp.]MDD4948375.1 hypothetical protein [Sulfuricurvum sp.]
MKRVVLSIVTMAIAINAGEISKVSHDKLKYYINRDTDTCEYSQVLVENSYDKTFKNQDDALTFMVKDFEKAYKGKCKAFENKEEKSVDIFCKGKVNDDDINIIFFSDKDSCTVWNEKDLAHQALVSSNDMQLDYMRDGLKDFQWIYNEKEDKCYPTLELFNATMSQKPITKGYVAKNMSGYFDSFRTIMNDSETVVTVYMDDNRAKIEMKSPNGEESTFYYGSTMDNCKSWKNATN